MVTKIISQLWKCEKNENSNKKESTEAFFHKYYEWKGVDLAKREEIWRKMPRESKS